MKITQKFTIENFCNKNLNIPVFNWMFLISLEHLFSCFFLYEHSTKCGILLYLFRNIPPLQNYSRLAIVSQFITVWTTSKNCVSLFIHFKILCILPNKIGYFFLIDSWISVVYESINPYFFTRAWPVKITNFLMKCKIYLVNLYISTKDSR